MRDDARRSSELLTVSFRYKQPAESESRLLSVAVKDRNTRFADASDNFRFSAAVAEFGMILRGLGPDGQLQPSSRSSALHAPRAARTRTAIARSS